MKKFVLVTLSAIALLIGAARPTRAQGLLDFTPTAMTTSKVTATATYQQTEQSAPSEPSLATSAGEAPGKRQSVAINFKAPQERKLKRSTQPPASASRLN